VLTPQHWTGCLHKLFCFKSVDLQLHSMSQLLLVATILLLLLVGVLSLDIMGFAFWKSNKFLVEGKVC
jgi:hypothetical protein